MFYLWPLLGTLFELGQLSLDRRDRGMPQSKNRRLAIGIAVGLTALGLLVWIVTKLIGM
jgi:hypothetical protein